jgi:hypothetical protein
MPSMQEQLVRRYQRLLRELAASSSSRGAQAPLGAADALRPVPVRRRTAAVGTSARSRLRDLAQARYD